MFSVDSFLLFFFFFFFKQKTAYEIVSRDWSSDVCSSDLTVLTTLAVYYMCWLPMGVWTMWDFVSTTHPAGSPDWLGYFAVQMMVLNSGMCFLIYYNTLTRFKMTFQLNKVFGVTSGTTQTTASSQQPLQGFVSRRAWGSELLGFHCNLKAEHIVIVEIDQT